VELSDRDRQLLTHMSRVRDATTESIALVLGWSHEEAAQVVQRLTQYGYITSSDSLHGLSARMARRGDDALAL
jgi:hypothetical protein